MSTVFAVSLRENLSFPAEQLPHVSIYEIVYRIFHTLGMVLQYSFLMGSILIDRCFCLPVSISRKFLTVRSFNLAQPSALPMCLKSALWPIPKVEFSMHDVGMLRITYDIIYRPASGLCMGMCLTFLSEYYKSQCDLLCAANSLCFGGNETSVKVQALYDALLGMQGTFDPRERSKLLALLRGEPINKNEIYNQELLTSLEAFKTCVGERPFKDKAFLIFVFDNLKKRQINITPDLYALILDLAAWLVNSQCSEMKPNYRRIDNLIISSIAPLVGLNHSCVEVDEKLVNSSLMISEGVQMLRNIKEGCYLLPFPNHVIVYIKKQNEIAIFDPTVGLAIATESEEREELLTHMLKYYSNGVSLSLGNPIQFKRSIIDNSH